MRLRLLLAFIAIFSVSLKARAADTITTFSITGVTQDSDTLYVGQFSSLSGTIVIDVTTGEVVSTAVTASGPGLSTELTFKGISSPRPSSMALLFDGYNYNGSRMPFALDNDGGALDNSAAAPSLVGFTGLAFSVYGPDGSELVGEISPLPAQEPNAAPTASPTQSRPIVEKPGTPVERPALLQSGWLDMQHASWHPQGKSAIVSTGFVAKQNYDAA